MGWIPYNATVEMLDMIEKLLILQDRDRKIRRIKGELIHIEPQRQTMKTRAAAASTSLENAKTKVKELESQRKDLELEVEAKKQMIVRYANQQLQTRKNEEYRALANEIQTCKEAIFKIEDQEIALMEQGEAAQKEVVRATQAASEARKLADDQVVQLGDREENLKKERTELETNREELAAAVDSSARGRYDRLVKNKGENVVVGVQHGVCGGAPSGQSPQLDVVFPAPPDVAHGSKCTPAVLYTLGTD